jgi:excisionase family DNA binding protein
MSQSKHLGLDEAGSIYLTRAAVARMLGVSPNTVTRWAREGRLPCQVTLGGHHRFDVGVIQDLRVALHRDQTVVSSGEIMHATQGPPRGRS